MKSQDIGLLLKLASLQMQENTENQVKERQIWPGDGYGKESNNLNDLPLPEVDTQNYTASRYTARSLERETGISKTQINLILNRCYDVGLAKKDRHLGVPRANTRALFDFIVHGIKYVFPAKPRELTRGVATGFAAPVLKDKLLSAGDFILVWPDAKGDTKGQMVEPLFKSVTFAIKHDPHMYALLALVDAIRLGQPREANLARELLADQLKV